MTVAELIVELQKLPQNVTIEVAGYVPNEQADRTFDPEYIEALKDGEGTVTAVIWAKERAKL